MEDKARGGPDPMGTGRDTRDAMVQTAGQLKDRALAEGDKRKDGVADQVDETADNIHRTADALREGRQGWLAELVDRGADELGQMAETLRSNDLQGLLSQIDSFARRQPALFAGASIAAGFAMARMARIALEQGSGTPSRGMPTASRSQPNVASRSPDRPPEGAMYHG